MKAPDVSQAWVDEQLRHFPPGSMDGVVRMIRAFERADRERAHQMGDAA